ncbi:PREDICTED: uncharacterized protein LOC107066492 [Polistes dominula]|uniref:Uncharacterized protein LOC107066492 n=1 Tax=Polistes dominula TaxID=743375 RepID=A0ABM1I8V2_POLDO|nr:PREDICTED: uncharacterized protein LOC107066492 [Polistes dominula]
MLEKNYFSMENISNYSISTLINNIFFHLTGFEYKDQLIIRVNNEKLSTNGDLYFPANLTIWKNLLVVKLDCNNDCNNILQHYAHTRGIELKEVDKNDTNEKVLQSFISASKTWNYKITKCTLQKERICLFLDRPSVIKTIISTIIEKGSSFGKNPSTNKEICLTFHPDVQSELTSTRLKLIKDVSERILDLQGYRICKKVCSNSIVLTHKFNGKRSKDCNTYLCGVVKNLETNTKETMFTWSQYIHYKIKMIKEQNEHKYLNEDKQDIDSFLRNMAEGAITFELLTIKPIRPVFVNVHTSANRSLTNTKGIFFIFYNIVRIAAIIKKYDEGISNGDYPELPDIKTVDFSILDNESEWELIYNFMVGYSQAIENSVRHIPTFQICPQILCAFLSRLCQNFSIYYSKIKILTEGYKHLHSKLIARIYMLKALEIILQNALAILNIKSVSRM